MRWIQTFVFFFLIIGTSADERGLSLQDLIQGALSLVKPIFDTDQPLRDMDSPMIPRVVGDDSHIFEDHQQAALGVENGKDDVKNIPICRGDSKICKFIACAAHNFKHDQNFANLNLAAQLLSDKQMRKTITNNPDSVISVCREQGLSDAQCRLFSQGFQVVDKFITVIEPKDNAASQDTGASRETVDSRNSDTLDKSMRIIASDQEADPPKIPRTVRPIGKFQSSPSMGSRTWSTHTHQVLSSSEILLPKAIMPEVVINHRTTAEKKPYTNAKFSTSRIHVPVATAPTHLPTPGSPIVPVIQRPIAKAPKNQNIGFSLDEENLILARPKRDTVDSDFEDFEPVVRKKRDYYDQVEASGQERTFGRTSESSSRLPSSSGADSDYYDNVDKESNSKSTLSSKNSEFTPMNCFAFLG
ncbi:hypothetical protein FO519_006356 [Halicephalobus sp. NKZ332]|nr:hypothetical protein FO519_006356 [Halicephalobus sp. NKZ332]